MNKMSKRKTIGFESLPQALIPAFNQLPPYFSLNGFKTLANKIATTPILIHTIKYWAKRLFEKYELIEKNTEKLYYHKKISNISSWIKQIAEEIGNEEINKKFDKLFYPIAFINKYNQLPMQFFKNDLIDDKKKLTKMKITYWLEKMVKNNIINIKNKDKRLTKTNQLNKKYGLTFSDWLKTYFFTKIETIEKTLEI